MFVLPEAKTPRLLTVEAAPTAILPSDADAEAVGAAVLEALEASRDLVVEGPELEPLLAGAGVKSYGAFVRGATCAEVGDRDGSIVVTEMRNRGPREGFEWTDREHRVPVGDVEGLGAAVRRALDLGPAGPAEPAESPGDAPTVDEVLSMADWMAEALESSGYDADFSGASLREVERFFAEQLEGPASPLPGSLLDEDVGPRLFGLGAYVGETIRRAVGGDWSTAGLTGAEDEQVRLELADGSVVWPVQRVIARYRSGSEESLVAYGAALGVGPSPPERRRFWQRGR